MRTLRMMAGWTMDLGAWIFMGGWAIALIAAVVLLVWTPRRRDDSDDPVAILRERLARGELSPDEFERALRLLGSSDGKANR